MIKGFCTGVGFIGFIGIIDGFYRVDRVKSLGLKDFDQGLLYGCRIKLHITLLMENQMKRQVSAQVASEMEAGSHVIRLIQVEEFWVMRGLGQHIEKE